MLFAFFMGAKRDMFLPTTSGKCAKACCFGPCVVGTFLFFDGTAAAVTGIQKLGGRFVDISAFSPRNAGVERDKPTDGKGKSGAQDALIGT